VPWWSRPDAPSSWAPCDPAAAACADRAVFLVGGRVVGKIDHPTADEVAAELTRQQPDQG
jgi:putative ABC transport system ATP-binding protein